MSDLQDLIHRNAQLVYEQGEKHERERILKIIADYKNKPSFGYANLVALIKGEQK